MHLPIQRAVALILFLAAAAFTPAQLAGSVRVSEIHYDNVGTDAGEAIEISAPAGTDLSGWQVVLYNGSPNIRAPYNTRALSETVPATCGTRGVIVLQYAVNGIQNGGTDSGSEPDGLALVDATGSVVEFLSYEGSFTALSGPATGMTSTDIGVRQRSDTPAGHSLQRNASGTWMEAQQNTFGTCNDAGEEPPPAIVASVIIAPASATISVGTTEQLVATARDAQGQPISGVAFTWASNADGIASVSPSGVVTGVAAGDAEITATAPNGVFGTTTIHVENAPPPPPPSDVRITEIHYDNFGSDSGEAIEIEGPAGTDVTGWSVVLYNGNGGGVYNTRVLTGTIAATCAGRGVIVATYPTDGIQNGSPDGVALVDASGNVVEFLSYEGTMTATSGPAMGMLSVDIGVAQSSSPVGLSLQRLPAGIWVGPQTATFGACNDGTPPPPPAPTISFTGRVPSDPSLPVGFQDQIFATYRDATGTAVSTTFTWVSDTPAVAMVDEQGVITALAAGTAVIRATAQDGTTATVSLPTRVATPSATSQYANHVEFGTPSDSDSSDDYPVEYAQYIASWSPSRGTPNWVAYNLEETHFGPEDRCDCFTFDPSLPAQFPRYTTADYTGAGAHHGYGIDRGHLVRSFDRTAGSLDNAYTFYFTNIIPQAADLNQGPWAAFESYVGDLARRENKEVYVITGVAGSKGTVKGEGKIVIPAATWKVAVIMPRDRGLRDVVDYRDLEVLAVNMPNDPGIRNQPWQNYLVTVDAVEAASGYDLLHLLPEHIEAAVEANVQPPLAAINGPWLSSEGDAVHFSGAASFDPNGTITSWAWSFGDGATATGATATHTYAQDGQYVVTLTVTDNDGLTAELTSTATVRNVAPAVSPFAGATLLPGEIYSASGSFTDPGADVWTATVDYGHGVEQALALSGQSFTLSHRYDVPGTFTVTVRVADDDAFSTGSATVTVLASATVVQQLIAQINAWQTANVISAGNGVSLRATLSAADRDLQSGNFHAAAGVLNAFVAQLDALVQSRRLDAGEAAPVRDLATRLIASITRN